MSKRTRLFKHAGTVALTAALLAGCTAPAADLTHQQQESVALAQSYLDQGPHSRDRLTERLEQAGQEPLGSDALDVLEVNWSEQALAQAQEFLQDPVSEQLLRKLLRTDRFTEPSIEYAMQRIEADWNQNAVRMLEERWRRTDLTHTAAEHYLTYRLFSDEEIAFALENAEIDWEN